LSQSIRLTDGQTDGQTNRILIARPRLHSIQRGKKLHSGSKQFKAAICETWMSGNNDVLVRRRRQRRRRQWRLQRQRRVRQPDQLMKSLDQLVRCCLKHLTDTAVFLPDCDQWHHWGGGRTAPVTSSREVTPEENFFVGKFTKNSGETRS